MASAGARVCNRGLGWSHQRGSAPLKLTKFLLCFNALSDARSVTDCNLKKNEQILIVFGTSISDRTGHQMTILAYISPKTQRLFLHYLQKHALKLKMNKKRQ